MPSNPEADRMTPGFSPLGRGASDLGSQVQETAGSIADSQISKQKESATGVLDQVADALRKTGEHLRGSQQERIAGFAEQAADRVQEFSGSVRGSSPRDWIRKTEDVARREPGLFLGGAFVVGLLGARFLKSSERASTGPHRSVPSTVSREEFGGAGRYSGTGISAPRPDLDLDDDHHAAGGPDVPSAYSREH